MVSWHSLTLGVHAQREVVGSVCLSVKSHPTSGASVRPENTVTYSAGNGGQKFVGFSLKLLHSKDMELFVYLRHPTVIISACFDLILGW